MRSREASPAFLHAACCHEHRDSTPTCLRRASAQAPGARCAEPPPPLHCLGHCSFVHGFRAIDGLAKIGQQLLKTAKRTPMPFDFALPPVPSRVLNKLLLNATATTQA